MKNEAVTFAVLSLLLALTASALMLKAICFFTKFSRTTRRIAERIERAADGDEYKQRRKELYCHYLCLIPFVNERNAEHLYDAFHNKAKHTENTKRCDALGHILAPSLIGICLCTVFFCGASWAWFTATKTSNVSVIRSAVYTVEVTAKIGGASVDATDNGGIYTIALESGKTYDLTIVANGTADKGYCTVNFGEKEYHTDIIAKNTAFTFKVTAGQSGNLTITPQWGTCTASENLIELGDMIALDINP